jgi:hypothetical protein
VSWSYATAKPGLFRFHSVYVAFLIALFYHSPISHSTSHVTPSCIQGFIYSRIPDIWNCCWWKCRGNWSRLE